MLNDLIEIAKEAGVAIMAIYDAVDGPDARTKGDGSPVTLADEHAELVILTALAKIAPGIAVVAEESVAAGRVPPPSARFFLVDPLDGTKEFISRNGEFTVNIALIETACPSWAWSTCPQQASPMPVKWVKGQRGTDSRFLQTLRLVLSKLWRRGLICRTKQVFGLRSST